MSQNMSQAPVVEDGSTMRTGDRVEIVGLKSRPEYNNTFGIIEGYNGDARRWQVRMEHDGSLKDLKD